MNKKYLLAILLVIAAAAAIFFFVYLQKKKKTDAPAGNTPSNTSAGERFTVARATSRGQSVTDSVPEELMPRDPDKATKNAEKINQILTDVSLTQQQKGAAVSKVIW